jgi:hypothetical protein
LAREHPEKRRTRVRPPLLRAAASIVGERGWSASTSRDEGRPPGLEVVGRGGCEGDIGSAAVVKEIVRDVQTWSVFTDQKGYALQRLR